MPKEKPTGVTIFGIVHIVVSAWSLISTIGILIVLTVIPALSKMTAQLLPQWYLLSSSILGLFIAGAGLAAGIGVLMLKPWARMLLIIVAVFALVVGLMSLIYSIATMGVLGMLGIVGYVIAAVYYGLMLWYFNTAPVRAAFNG